MINKEQYVEWALLLTELEEAGEHLQALSKAMNTHGRIEEEEFRVMIGHIYAHLNRAWNMRDHLGAIAEEQFNEFSKFPSDLVPVG